MGCAFPVQEEWGAKRQEALIQLQFAIFKF